MEFQAMILCLVFALATAATVPSNEEVAQDVNDIDNEPAESNNILNIISAIKPSAELFNNNNRQSKDLDLGTFPYAPKQNVYDTFPIPQPTLGIAINSQALLAPKVELLTLLEATINLIGDTLASLQKTINDNYEFFRAIFNFVISKASAFKSLILKGIGIVRKVLEFVLNIFNGLSITLPTITFGANVDDDSSIEPHLVYGVPPSP